MMPLIKDPKIVISGYYGFDNCGDEAVLLAIIHCIKKICPDAKITVLSGNPEKTRKLYGVNSINRWNPARIALEVLRSHLLLSGGGSLLQDVTSSKSPLYYLAVIRIALFLRKKVIIYCQGIGPIDLEGNRKKIGKVINRCHAITTRDIQSAELLRDIGVTRNIQVACDPVMALEREDLAELCSANSESVSGKARCRDSAAIDLLREAGVSDGSESSRKPLLLAAIRCWKDDRHIAPIAELLNAQIEKGWDVLLIPAHFPEDYGAISKLTALMPTKPRSISRCLTASEFFHLTAIADKVFSMRLHGLICAMAVGTPMIGLSYDPKVDAFMEQAGLEKYCLSFDRLEIGVAKRLMEELDDKAPDTLKDREARRKKMHETAWNIARSAFSWESRK